MTEPIEPPVGGGRPPACQEARRALRGYDRGELPPAEHAAIAIHLASCQGCRQVHAAEAALDTALHERLPRFAAPVDLRHKVAAAWTTVPVALDPPASPASAPAAHDSSAPSLSAPPRSSPPPVPPAAGLSRSPLRAMPQGRSAFVGFAVAAAFVVAWVAFHSGRDPGLGAGALVAEAVNDHLRVVQSSHPVEIESGGIHQVKPWFTGKLDFAPRVTFSGDDEFPLVGGSVGYFIDRKAAVMVFRHKLHTLTLLVLPRAGLPWPASSTASSRGFHLRFWQRDDLGFVLVSDANAATLASLGERLEGE